MTTHSSSVLAQIRLAFRPANRLAALGGCLLGGIVPVATYAVAHYEATWQPANLPSYLVVGGLVFSAKTVFGWARQAFACRAKAAGFCLLLEGTMVASSLQILALVCLATLVAINAIATACTLVSEAAPVRKSSARKSATSARPAQLRRVG